MSGEVLSTMPFEQFLALEASGGARHEYVGGQVYAMSGGTERHDLAVGYLMQLLAPAARSQGCRTFGGNRLLRTSSDASYYPDLMVVCGRAADVRYEDDAALIVEVLSQSTRAIDRREKLEAYRRLRSLSMYLLVEPTIRRFEAATFAAESRDISWEVYGPGAVLVTPYLVLDLDAVYDVLDADATT